MGVPGDDLRNGGLLGGLVLAPLHRRPHPPQSPKVEGPPPTPTLRAPGRQVGSSVAWYGLFYTAARTHLKSPEVQH